MKRLKGLFTDTKPINQPEGTYRNMLNGLVNKNMGSIVNEVEPSILNQLPSGYTYVSHLVIDNDIVFYLVNNSTSLISLYSNNAFTTILSTPLLAFDKQHPILSIYSYNNKNERIIYFTDGINAPRFLNIDNHSITESNLYLTILFPSMLKPIGFEFVNFGINGTLPTGVYFVACSYMTDSFDETDVSVISKPIYIVNDTDSNYTNFDGSKAGTPTNKSIQFSLSNLDTNYKYLQLYLLSKQNGVIQPVRKLPFVVISNTISSLEITGTEQYTDSSIEILIPKSHYKTADTIALVDDSLYLGGLTKYEDIGFQKYANSIELEAVTEEFEYSGYLRNGVPIIPFDDSYKKLGNQKKSYQRDEIYAFYISFLLKNGKESLAYHIPGREPEVISVSNNVPVLGQDGLVTITGNIDMGKGFADNYTNGRTPMVFGVATNTQYSVFTIKPSSGEDINVTVDIVSGETGIQIASKFVTYVNNNLDWVYLGAGEYGDTGMVSNSTKLSDLFTITNVINGVPTEYVRFLAKVESLTLNGFYVQAQISPGVPFTANSSTGGGDSGLGIANTIEIQVGGVSTVITFTENTLQSSIVTQVFNALDSNVSLNTYTFSLSSNIITISKSPRVDFIINTNIDFGELSTLVITKQNGEEEVPATTNIYENTVSNTFQDDAQDYINGTAYWENQNEIYPDNGNFDIWTINGSGVGISTGNTLRNKQVRHHHFPEHKYNQFVTVPANIATTPLTVRPLGFKLKNLKIPNDIAEQVTGYKVYRAKRDGTILGQGNVIFQYHNDPYIGRNPGTSDADVNANLVNQFTVHDFRLLHNQLSINEITKAKVICFPDKVLFQNTSGVKQHIHFVSKYDNFLNDAGVETKFIDINAKARIPSDTEIVLLGENGFSNDIRNKRGTSTLLFQTQSSMSIGTSSLSNINHALVNLKNNKTNLYNSFYNQQLIWTGYQDLDISNFTQSGTVSGRTKYQSKTIFGGDTFIQGYTYATRGKPTNDNTHYSLTTTIVESQYNIGLRNEGIQLTEKYYPKSTYAEVLEPSNIPHDEHDDYLDYNIDYSAEDEFSQVTIYNPFITQIQDYSNRIIRSIGNSLTNNNTYRLFLLEDFLDLPRSKGKIKNLENFNDNLLIHTSHSMFVTRGREEMVTNDVRAFIGLGNIFQYPPKEIMSLDYSYAGLQHPFHKINTHFGYFFCDSLTGKIYQYTGQLKEISNNGLRNDFESIIPYNYKLSEYDSNLFGLTMGFDPVRNRILVTKRDRKLKSDYTYISNNDFLFTFSDLNDNQDTKSILNNDFFDNEYYTYSFVADLDIWVSKHSYYPIRYINKNNELLHIFSNSIKKHYVGNSKLPFEFEFVDNEKPNKVKQASAIKLMYHLENNGVRELEPLTTIRIKNSSQDSGLIPLVAFPDALHNTRNRNNAWFISKFRDMLENGVINPTKDWFKRQRISDNYAQVTVTYNGSKDLYLEETKVDFNE